MDEKELESQIIQVSRRPLPECPGSFEADVLRKVRLRKQKDVGVADWLGDMLLHAGFVVSAILFMVIASAAVSSIAAPSIGLSDREAAGRALGFEIITEPQVFKLEN